MLTFKKHCNQKREGNLQTSDTLDQTQMLLIQTTPMSHALLMHQTQITQLTLLLQNVSVYLHHVHNTILMLELINNSMDPFFNSPTSLVLLCWIYQIYWMWLLISSLTSLIHPHSASSSCCSTSTQRKNSQLSSNNNHNNTPKLLSPPRFPPVPSFLRSETYLLT